MDRTAKSVDSSQTLSPATHPLPVIDQWANEHSGHNGSDGGCTWAQQHGLLLTSNYMAMTTAKCPIGQQQIPELSFQGDQPATKLLLMTMDYLHHGRDRTPSLLEQTLILHIDLLPLHVMLQNHSCWSYRIPNPSSSYSTQHCFWPRQSLSSQRSTAMGSCS